MHFLLADRIRISYKRLTHPLLPPFVRRALKSPPDFFFPKVAHMLPITTSLIIIAAVFMTSILSGILGMAGGMVLMGVLVWLLPVAPAMMLHATAQFFANGSRALFHREHIYFKSTWWFLAALLFVFALFAFASYMPSKLAVFTLLGVAPFLSFALPKKMKLDFTKPAHAFICGLTVMGFHLTGGVSGPLLDIFFQNTSLTRHQTVATKAFTQTLSHGLRVVYFGLISSTLHDGLQGVPLWLFAAVIPVAIGATSLSKKILDRLTDKQFFKATQVALLIVGCVYLAKACSLWLTEG